MGLALAGSVVVQVAGLSRVRTQVEHGAQLEAMLRASGSPVLVTGREALFRVLGFLYFDRVLLAVSSPKQLRELVSLLAARRVARWTYVPYSGSAFDARVVERWTSSGPWRFRVTRDYLTGIWVADESGAAALRLITYVGGAP